MSEDINMQWLNHFQSLEHPSISRKYALCGHWGRRIWPLRVPGFVLFFAALVEDFVCIGWRLKLHWCTGWACTKYGHEMTVGELLQPLNTDSPDYLSIHPSIYSFIYSSIYLFESLYDDNCPHQGNRTERKQTGLFGATKSRLVSNLTVLGLKLGRTGAHFGPKCANFRSPVHFFAACPGRTFPPSVEAGPVWQICPYCSLLKFC